MIEFTLEELKTLEIGLGHVEDRSADIEDILIIRKKLQSMIEDATPISKPEPIIECNNTFKPTLADLHRNE